MKMADEQIQCGPLLLYKTSETHTNGMEMYRQRGTKEWVNHRGKTGVYYVFDGTRMYVCGEPYKDEFGCHDGEPLWPITGYTIVE